MSSAAIVLCGGRSRRMGKDKYALDFGGETLLDRTIRILRSVVDEIVVVAREGTDVPATVRDPAEGLGPLAGLTAGLEAMKAGRAFLAACDAPFLKPEYVRLLLDLAEGHDAAVPLVDGYHMTTAAVYGKSVLPVARRLLDERRLRPLFLIHEIDARIVSEEEVRAVDPDLASLRNCNTQESYRQALKDAGLYTPDSNDAGDEPADESD